MDPIKMDAAATALGLTLGEFTHGEGMRYEATLFRGTAPVFRGEPLAVKCFLMGCLEMTERTVTS